MVKLTGSTYRTCKARLVEAGVEPAKRTRKGDLYHTREALAAVAQDAPWHQVMECHEHMWKNRMLGLIGRYLVNGVSGYLREDCGLSKAEAVKAGYVALQLAMMAGAEFFMHDPETDQFETENVPALDALVKAGGIDGLVTKLERAEAAT